MYVHEALSTIRTVVHLLCFFVLLFQLALHFKVRLPLAFDSLLFHISDHACVHCLRPVSAASPQAQLELTAFSAVWAQWTKATMPIVPTIVPASVTLEAVDMIMDLRK